MQVAKSPLMRSPFGSNADPWEKPMEEGPAESEQESSSAAVGHILVQCWPVLGAIFFSGTFFVLAFPFFVYIPSDGTFGQELPRVSAPLPFFCPGSCGVTSCVFTTSEALLSQVLFFSRLLADVCGRTIPRVKRLALHSRMSLFALGCFMTASIPGYLYYIQSSPWHNDWAIIGVFLASFGSTAAVKAYLSVLSFMAVMLERTFAGTCHLAELTGGRACAGYIVVMWVIGGIVNTCCYVVAPTCVEPHHKAAANGLLAIFYQSAHCTGLIAATAISGLVFGSL